MKKIGIITLTEGYNYGNKLQNYALLKFLKSQFPLYEIQTLNNKISTMTFSSRTKIFLKSIIPSNKNKRIFIRKKVTKHFNKQFLNFGTNLTSNKIISGYTMIVCGSDQIWNPLWFKNVSPMMGSTINPNTKIVSYAASFGISKLPSNQKYIYSESLKYLDKISVRERKGFDILTDLGFHGEILIDPTLLIETSNWTEIEKKPRNLKTTNYVVIYFLGQYPKEFLNFLNKNFKKDYAFIFLNDPKNNFFEIDPTEFIYLIHNASYIFTDSFHASIFSIVFNKHFVVYERIENSNLNMVSRIETLLNLFKLDKHFNTFDINILNECINEEEKNKTIEGERKKAHMFFGNII